MFCYNCICYTCPYGLKCNICDTYLDGHILLVEGCNGQREEDKCLFDYIAREETGVPEHAEMLREMIRNKDSASIEAFFDYKDGPYHKAIRERLGCEFKSAQKEKSYEDD